ncbi:uroporphyrinogen-III C-methyltransferase [Anaerobacillus alkaliphilus]|uniref:Uroporphyrinogen-III C-methyltransferase n=1 Tax=Anaerobacillus alkaliphilus TaxID=1548597 RepID=A0A4Q0VWJ2_9BACI|nr:uroporphyrinogen-III C-methyltransferase [Anaerobacillus alkaliphilus]RXJ04083.1 uroporphyrinogen-III C-methyltransferase [Anaerobacillus alkaliphilus]
MTKKGFVYLVGAGPGDEKLITVKGLEALRQAEVVLYDRLVNPLLLQEVDANTELIYCGKLPDRHIVRQENINELLVEKAKEGKLVVRLKGGDPGVFGRVGEEALALKQENIGYEIVPGITSGIAAAAYAGIPVTHREYGTSFTVITGHDKSSEGKPLINWQALAQGSDTIAFYMGVKNLPYICDNLVQNGKASDTKVAVIQWGTTSQQKVVEGTLDTIVGEVERHNISNPAITLVGNIVALRKQLKWFEDKPLFRRKIIFPNASSEQVATLKNSGAEVLAYPRQYLVQMLEQDTLRKVVTYEDILFTTKESVSLFFEGLQALKIDIRLLKASLYYTCEEIGRLLKQRGLFAEKSLSFTHQLTVGTVQDEELYQGDYLATHLMKNHEPVSVAFKRMVEENGFNTVIFSDVSSVKAFIEQVPKDGNDPFALMEQCQVICLTEEANQAAIHYQIPVTNFEKNFSEVDLPQLLLQNVEIAII